MIPATQHLWFGSALLPSGWADRVRLTIADGIITNIEVGADPGQQDESHDVALPGMANLHSHAFQRGMAGLAETRGPVGDDFWTWREIMYRFVLRMTPDDIEALAALAYIDMLEAGFTRVGEFHYVHHDPSGTPYADIGETAQRIAAAAAETGIALTLLPSFYAHGGFGGAPPKPGQRRFIASVDEFGRIMESAGTALKPLPDAALGVAPHSLRAVTEDELNLIVTLSGSGPIHIHAAEQTREVEDSVAFSGSRPVRFLLDRFAVDQRWCLIHATHMDASETSDLAASGATAGLCPVTEANLGDGIFPADTYLASGGQFGIGTDSNVLIGAAAELRALEYSQRLSIRSRNILAAREGASTGADLFRLAIDGGHRALGRPGFGLDVGQPADIVSLNTDLPSLVHRRHDQWLDGWIFACPGGAVDRVWRRGVEIVREGRHRDRASIERRFAAVLKRVLD